MNIKGVLWKEVVFLPAHTLGTLLQVFLSVIVSSAGLETFGAKELWLCATPLRCSEHAVIVKIDLNIIFFFFLQKVFWHRKHHNSENEYNEFKRENVLWLNVFLMRGCSFAVCLLPGLQGSVSWRRMQRPLWSLRTWYSGTEWSPYPFRQGSGHWEGRTCCLEMWLLNPKPQSDRSQPWETQGSGFQNHPLLRLQCRCHSHLGCVCDSRSVWSRAKVNIIRAVFRREIKQFNNLQIREINSDPTSIFLNAFA